MLIKQWGSTGRPARLRGLNADAKNPESPCTFGFHRAFEDPATAPDAPDPRGIEVRGAALYD